MKKTIIILTNILIIFLLGLFVIIPALADSGEYDAAEAPGEEKVFYLDVRIIDLTYGRNEEEIFTGYIQAFEALTLTLGQLFQGLEFDFNAPDNTRRGLCWHLVDSDYEDTLLRNNLDMNIVYNLDEDFELTINLEKKTSIHRLNIHLPGGGSFMDTNNYLGHYTLPDVNVIGVRYSYLIMEVEYDTDLISILSVIYLNRLLRGPLAMFISHFYNEDEAITLVQATELRMPDNDLYLSAGWDYDIREIQSRGNAFGDVNNDGVFDRYMHFPLFADMPEERMRQVVLDTINEFGEYYNLVNIRHWNFTVNVERIEATEYHELRVIITINRVNFTQFNFEGTALDRLNYVDFDVQRNQIFRDMTREQIYDFIEKRLSSLNMDNFIKENFDVQVTFLSTENRNYLQILINRASFVIDYSGCAFRTDLLSTENLALYTNLYADMTLEEIRDSLNDTMDSLAENNTRLQSTNFFIRELKRATDNARVLVIEIVRVELVTSLIITRGTAFEDNNYNVSVLENIDLSGIYRDYTALQVQTIILDRIDAIGEDSNNDGNHEHESLTTEESSFIFERTRFSTPVITNYHNDNLTIYINRIVATTDFFGTAITGNRINEVSLYDTMDTIFRDLSTFEIYNIVNEAISQYAYLNDVNQFALDVFDKDLDRPNYAIVNIYINRINVTDIRLDGTASTEILTPNNLSLLNIYKDMTLTEISTLLYSRMQQSTNTRINDTFFEIYYIDGLNTLSMIIYINRNEVTLSGSGDAFNTELITQNMLDNNFNIYMDMPRQLIEAHIQIVLNNYASERISYAFFDVTFANANVHTDSLTITFARRRATPIFDGTAYTQGVLRSELDVVLYMDMTQEIIEGLVEYAINSIEGARFNYRHFDAVVVTQFHTVNVNIVINRTSVDVEFTGRAYIQDVLLNQLNVDGRVFKDMTSVHITSVVVAELNTMDPRFASANFTAPVVTNYFTNTVSVEIDRIEIDIDITVLLNNVDFEVTELYYLTTEFFKDMNEDIIRNEIFDFLIGLNRNDLQFTRTNTLILVDSVHTYTVDVTVVLQTALVNLGGTAIDVQLIPHNLLVGTDITSAFDDNHIREILADLLVGLNQDNLVYNNFTVTINRPETITLEPITININIDRTLIEDVTLYGTAVTYRTDIRNMNLGRIYEDMTLEQVTTRVDATLNGLTYNLRANNFEVEIVGHHTDELTITIDRREVTSLTVTGTAIDAFVFNSSDLKLPTLFFDNTNGEVIALVNNLIDTNLEVHLSHNVFAVNAVFTRPNTLENHTSLVITINRVRITPTIRGNAFVSYLLTNANLQTNTGIFKDMPAYQIADELLDRIDGIDGSRFNSNFFEIDPVTDITGTHTNNVIVYISRIRVDVTTSGSAFASDLLTRELLKLDTHIFKDMTTINIEDHLELIMNNDTSERISAAFFAVRIGTPHNRAITITIERINSIITIEGEARLIDEELYEDLHDLLSFITRDVTEIMIRESIARIMDDSNNPRIHSSHFIVTTISQAHAREITITINRVRATVEFGGTANRQGLLSHYNLQLATTIYRDMDESLIVSLLNTRMDALNQGNARIHSTHFYIVRIFNVHARTVSIDIDRVEFEPYTYGTAFDDRILEDIDLSGIYLDMPELTILEIVNQAIDAMQTVEENRLVRGNFTVGVDDYHSRGLTVTINRIEIRLDTRGTAVIRDRLFSQTDLGIDKVFFSDMNNASIEDYVIDAIDENLTVNTRFISEHFNVTTDSRDNTRIIILIDRIAFSPYIDGTAIGENGRFEASEMARRMHNVYRDMTNDMIEAVVNNALDTFIATTERFIARNFNVTIGLPCFNENTIDITIDRISLLITIQGNALGVFVPGAIEAHYDPVQGLINFMRHLPNLYLDMSSEDIAYIINNRLDEVGYELERSTVHQRAFNVYLYERCDDNKTITISIERIGITPEFGGDAIFPGGPILPCWLTPGPCNC